MYKPIDKYLVYFSLAVMIGNVAWAEAVQDEKFARAECSEFSQASMRDCLDKKANKSAMELGKTEEKALKQLSKWDMEPNYIALSKSKFEASSKEFIRYRKAHCDFNASLGGSAIGNALKMRRLACEVELNARRALQINSSITTLAKQ